MPYTISELEATTYYAGLPSNPKLVARTGETPWKPPTGPEAYRVIKELRTVGNHALLKVWEDKLALDIHKVLDMMEVNWTSTDVVRIGKAGESLPPVVLWIGVVPGSLSTNDGFIVASQCRECLEAFNITDVEVEIRESVVTCLAGPKLLEATYSSDPTVEIREPLTTTLGFPISAVSTHWTEGTSGFFIAEGGKKKRLLLVTARHVVLPDMSNNMLLAYKSNAQPRHRIMLFGHDGFANYLGSIQTKIEHTEMMIEHLHDRIRGVEGDTSPTARMERKEVQAQLDKAIGAVDALKTFKLETSTQWATPESRIIGFVVLSPPIDVGVGSEGYTDDWAIIEIDPSKTDETNFKGNFIDLGTHISPPIFTNMMYPDRRNPPSFKYPSNRLLKLQGTISDKEMRHPAALDHHGEPCLMVIKRGHATGLTIGRANNVVSYVRMCYGTANAKTSKEWAILPQNSKSGPFSAKGDSGSVIVDGLGRIGGLLTGGAGATDSPDITYATPISFLLKRMAECGLYKPHINPELTT
ncbi:hypothetical protein OPQ81_008993 [Rhizoctonia solani]|nr:hypothetical protein OPQ81_008993 [Rhizoctonia solani]